MMSVAVETSEPTCEARRYTVHTCTCMHMYTYACTCTLYMYIYTCVCVLCTYKNYTYMYIVNIRTLVHIHVRTRCIMHTGNVRYSPPPPSPVRICPSHINNWGGICFQSEMHQNRSRVPKFYRCTPPPPEGCMQKISAPPLQFFLSPVLLTSSNINFLNETLYV